MAPRSALTRWALCGALVAGGACVPVPDDPFVAEELALPPVDTTVERARPAHPRADEVEGFLTIEGMREPMTFRLFRSPAAFPLDFETYLPADVLAETRERDGGEAIAFVPNFGGNRVAAELAITVPEGEHSAAEAQRLVRETAARLGETERVSSGGYTWALEEYRFRAPGRVGSVALGRHDGTYFFVTTRFPVEMGDGFGARIARILGEWRWADGSRLGS